MQPFVGQQPFPPLSGKRLSGAALHCAVPDSPQTQKNLRLAVLKGRRRHTSDDSELSSPHQQGLQVSFAQGWTFLACAFQNLLMPIARCKHRPCSNCAINICPFGGAISRCKALVSPRDSLQSILYLAMHGHTVMLLCANAPAAHLAVHYSAPIDGPQTSHPVCRCAAGAGLAAAQ